MITLKVESFLYDDDDGAPLLAGVRLAVRPGEYVVVAGASGSGKTTLARLLGGLTGADAGSGFRGSLALDGETIRFGGLSTDPRIDAAAWSAKVAYVARGAWGQLSMMSSTVGEELAFGPSNRGVPAEELRRRVSEVAKSLKLTGLLDRDPRTLSGGQLQRTVIGAAMAQRPRVLVLDEPFQGLDDDAARDVAKALDVLRKEGAGVVVCEPMLPSDAPAGARVLGLAHGRPVFDGLLVEARLAGLRRYGIGTAGRPLRFECVVEQRAVEDRAVEARAHKRRPVDQLGPERVSVQRLSYQYPSESGSTARPAGLTDVDLFVRAREIVALRGANGSGKSTVLQHLNGLCRAHRGSVTVEGVTIGRQPTGSLAATVGYLFQDTDQQLFERTVLREVSYGPRSTGSPKDEAARRAAAALERVGLEAVAEAHPYELGFGQRRLVALACLIATGPVIWALDEPTAGLDEPARARIAALLTEHAQGGGAVVLATHDEAFADAVAHRSVWLDDGRICPQDPVPRR